MLESIPRSLNRKKNIGIYGKLWVEIYLEEKVKKEDKAKKEKVTIAQILENIILEQEDFKELLGEHFRLLYD